MIGDGEERRLEGGEGPREESEKVPEKQEEKQERVQSVPEAGGVIP